jgi:hypothetical protein
LASPKFWNYTRWLQVFVLLFIALGLWLFWLLLYKVGDIYAGRPAR